MKRRIGIALGLLVAMPPTARAGEFDLDAILLARGGSTRTQAPWLAGGFGRLTEGGELPGDTSRTLRGQAHLGVDWKPTPTLLVHLHGLARSERGPDGDRLRIGVPEAFVQYRPELSPSTTLRLRLGTFFPPTSRENTASLWTSPYTLTLSALNTWIAEELRLTGFDGALVLGRPAAAQWRLEGSLFGGADTSGSLVSWRGWSFSDRISTLGEILPLPPLPSLAPGGGFAGQRGDGTRPLDELDRRLGWQARLRWEKPETALFQFAYLDNRGDRALHRMQYAWHTRVGQSGLEWRPIRSLTLAAEFAWGNTGMGPANRDHVDVGFRVGYGLASWNRGRVRLSLRYDRFRNLDRDGTAEPNQESGQAWTTAAFFTLARRVRLGAEYLDLHSERPAAAFSGASANTDARQALLELRLIL